MKRNRMLIVLGLCVVLVLVCAWLFPQSENEVHDIPSPKTIPGKSKPKAVALGGGGTGMPAQSAEIEEPAIPRFVVGKTFYEDNTSLDDHARGVSLNRNLLGGLEITDDTEEILSKSIVSVVERFNAKTVVILHPGVSAISPNRSRKIAYKIQPKDTSLIDQTKQEIKDSLIVVLGETKGTELFRRVALAADRDPYLRGFGANSVVIYMSPYSDASLSDFRWEYQVLAPDGTILSSGERNSPRGIPSPFKDLFHTKVLQPGN